MKISIICFIFCGVFAIFITLTCGFSRMDEALENDEYRLRLLEEYANWLSKLYCYQFEVERRENQLTKFGECIDIIFYPNKKVVSYDFEVLMVYKFQKWFNATIRVRNIIQLYEDDENRCAFHFLVSFNTTNIEKDMSNWHNIKRLYYLIVIVPFDEQIDPTVFLDLYSHYNVVVIVGYRIYKLTEPFKSNKRDFKEIDSNLMFINNVGKLDKITSFDGQHLRVSSIQCAPMHNWLDDAEAIGKHVPRAGDSEDVCNASEKRLIAKSCSKKLLIMF